jgi:hypothetical protein
MSLKIGIVGLPNVGKSTLFRALTRNDIDIANYPFCTIEPNVGIVEVPDNRLERLSEISKSEKTTPTVIEFVDIAGLVSGAHKGEGLGNKFLSHIREVDAICQVVRNFSDPNITHVHNKIDPENDIEIINTELTMADMETAQKRLDTLKNKAKAGLNSELEKNIKTIEKILTVLEAGELANTLELDKEEKKIAKELNLLTSKPFIYAVNSDEEQIKNNTWQDNLDSGREYVPFCAKLEAELIVLGPAEVKEYLNELGWDKSGLDRLVLAGYRVLELITFFTSGPQESRAWTVRRGTKAPQAAGIIHTDFEKGFIRAEVCPWEKYIEAGGESAAKAKGWVRTEGKDYQIKDGDVCYFLHN